MSRTKKGSKGAGYEYWSKRPFAGDIAGRKTKTATHKRERNMEKELVREEKRKHDKESSDGQ